MIRKSKKVTKLALHDSFRRPKYDAYRKESVYLQKLISLNPKIPKTTKFDKFEKIKKMRAKSIPAKTQNHSFSL